MNDALSRRRLLGGGVAAVVAAGCARAIPPTVRRPIVADPTTSVVPSVAPVEAAPGTGRPPQFVAVSFDGSADNELLSHWRAVGDLTGARFSFFVSGAYLLLRANKSLYNPPRHGSGVSDIGFFPASGQGDAAAELRDLVEQLRSAGQAGH